MRLCLDLDLIILILLRIQLGMVRSIIGMPWNDFGSSVYSITCGVIQKIITFC
ncbi:hypothetical protein CsSME_00021724 [Camellia sinensis var. sinensis]